MKHIRKLIVLSMVLFGFGVSSAHAVNILKRIQGPTSYSIGSPSGNGTTAGSFVRVAYCNKVFLGVFTSWNNSVKAVAPYADLASTSTGTAYRTASLGAFGGQSDYFWRELTGVTSEYVRPVFTYTTGFTGTTEIWCQYENGAK